MKEKDVPLKLIRSWERRIPRCYEQLDYLADAKKDGEIWWPDWCPLPISAAFTLLVDRVGLARKEAAEYAAELTACWMWRQNKIVYAFDADLMRALVEQAKDMEDTDVLPVELLLHLPYPIIYVKTPEFVQYVDGFFAWNEWDVNRKAPELRVQMVIDDYTHSVPMVLHLIPGGTIRDCVRDTFETVMEYTETPTIVQSGASDARVILSAIQMLLYLTAENADVEDQPAPVRIERTGEKTARIIQDKAGEVIAKDVGVRVGSALRKAYSTRAKSAKGETTGLRRRAHTRRGHWHHYWTGPLDGERKLILKWTAPTIIHPEDGREDNVMVFPVKK